MKNHKNRKSNYGKNETFTEEEKAEIEEFLKQDSINLANLEKLGSLFLIVGYAEFFQASQYDILELCGIDIGDVSPANLTVNGQQLEFYGLIILTLVSGRRVNQKEIEKKVFDDEIDLTPFQTIYIAYLLSALSNFARLQAFKELAENEENEEGEENDIFIE